MKTFTLLTLLTIPGCFIQSCIDKPANDSATLTATANAHRDANNWWYCPDNIRGFPPVDIKLWNKVPVVNGRLPTFEETGNGTSLIYYDKRNYPDAETYNMALPKLASFLDPYTKRIDTVIVIQIVQTTYDTVVGYRYLTGGNGTYDFRAFHFLNDNEAKKAAGQ
jgi:hypothetical protein